VEVKSLLVRTTAWDIGPTLLMLAALFLLEPLGACANRQVAYYQRAIRRRCNRREGCQPSDCASLSTRPSKDAYVVCVIRCMYVTEVAKAANGMISTVAIELPSH
jgi:hypothetical protein